MSNIGQISKESSRAPWDLCAGSLKHLERSTMIVEM